MAMTLAGTPGLTLVLPQDILHWVIIQVQVLSCKISSPTLYLPMANLSFY